MQAVGLEEQRGTIHQLIEAVTIHPNSIAIDLRSLTCIGQSDGLRDPIATIEISNSFQLRQPDLHMTVDTAAPRPSTNSKTLIKAVARACTWYDDLVSGRVASARDIGEQEGLDERYVSQIIRLAFLDPAIVERLLDGTQSINIAAPDIARGLDLPMLWAEQAEAF